MASNAPQNGSTGFVAAMDGRQEGAEVGGCQDMRKGIEKFGKGGVLAGALAKSRTVTLPLRDASRYVRTPSSVTGWVS